MTIESLSPIYNTNQDSNIYKLLSIFRKQKKEIDKQIKAQKEIFEIEKQSGKVLEKIGENLLLAREGNNDAQYRIILLLAFFIRGGDVSIEGINYILRKIFLDVYTGCFDPNSLITYNNIYLDGGKYLNGSWYLSGQYSEPNFFQIIFKSLTETEFSFVEKILKIIKPAGVKYSILITGG